MHPHSLYSLAEHLERLSKDGDPLEVLAGTVEFDPSWTVALEQVSNIAS